MINGLVIGKFLPLHIGHIELINFAGTHCDQLYVLICSSPKHEISGATRLDWINATFKPNKKIRPIVIDIREDTFYTNQQNLDDLTKIWASNIQNLLPKMHCLIAGEEYGEPLARHLKCRFIRYDKPRIISGSAICQDPSKYWDLIAESARPFLKSFYK